MIQVRGPDGHIYQFPDGTSPQVMAGALQKRFGGPNTLPDPQYRQPVTEQQMQQFLHPNAEFRAPGAPVTIDQVRQIAGVPAAKPTPMQDIAGVPAAKPTPMQDMAATAPAGAIRAGTGIAGTFGNMADLADAGTRWIGHNIFGAQGDVPVPSDTMGPFPGFNRIQSQVVGPGVEGWLEQHGVPASISKIAGTVAGTPWGPMGAMPDSARYNAMAEAASGQPLYQPQTMAGRSLDTAEQLAPALLMPGTAAQRATNFLAPTAGSIAAGETAHALAPQYEQLARLGGALLGSFGGSVFTPTTVQRELFQGSQNASQAQLDKAAALLGWGHDNGLTSLTFPEALDYTTGGSTSMTRGLRLVEGTKEGQRVLGPLMAQRPGQVQSTASNVIDQIAPQPSDPSSLSGRASTAAQGVLDAVRRNINASASPYYNALAGSEIPSSQNGLWKVDPATGGAPPYDALSNNAAYAEALNAFRGDPVLNSANPVRGQPITFGDLPDNNLAVVNKVSSILGERGGALKAAGENTRASELGTAKATADELASALSPDYANARNTVSSGYQAFYDPLDVGPIGRLARRDQPTPQFSALYSDRIQPGAANETAQGLQLLDAQDPGVGASLTGQYLRGQLNDALSLTGSAQPNQWAGSKFVANVLGNPEQASAIRQGVGVVAPGAAEDFGNLTDALGATGARQRINFAQEGSHEDRLDWERGANALTSLTRAAIDLPGSLGEAKDLFDRWRLGQTGKTLANLWASPAEQQAAAVQGAYNAGDALGSTSDRMARALLLFQPLLSQAQQPAPQPQQ